jgi:DNA-binding transcriptional LysR family regulator
MRCAGTGIILSSVATRYQLGLLFHAGTVTSPLRASRPQGTCALAMKSASSGFTSAANVFDVLYRTRSTTRAAQSLNLTQPSVSNALKRLRLLFGDVLFVKTASGMQPTPRADGIAGLIDEGFASLRLALHAGGTFDPATSTRTFRLYVSDIGQSVFVPPLVTRLRQAGTGIRIVTADPPLDAAQQMMKLGQIDLAIGLFRELHADFLRQRLFHETYAVLVRNDHPAIGARTSMKP